MDLCSDQYNNSVWLQVFPNFKEVEFSAQDLETGIECVLLVANGKRLLNKRVTGSTL